MGGLARQRQREHARARVRRWLGRRRM